MGGGSDASTVLLAVAGAEIAVNMSYATKGYLLSARGVDVTPPE